MMIDAKVFLQHSTDHILLVISMGGGAGDPLHQQGIIKHKGSHTLVPHLHLQAAVPGCNRARAEQGERRQQMKNNFECWQKTHYYDPFILKFTWNDLVG
jgi:hypothetical protein